MLHYIKMYEAQFDQVIQCPVAEETAAKARDSGLEVSAEPFPDLVVTSRNRSERKVENGRIVG